MEKVNVYQMVTDRIIEELQKGIIPWHKPWSGAGLADGGAVNYVSRKPYSMLNQMLLGREGEYLTFKQVKDLGGDIKKGAKSSMVVFFTMISHGKKKTQDENGNETEVTTAKEHIIPVLKYYRVFHIDDTTGIEKGEYLTFKQVKDLGGDIKKGAKSSMVVFFTMISHGKKKTQDENGNETEVTTAKEHIIPVLKYYRVFHIDDTTGIESKIKAGEPIEPTILPIESAENIINGYLSREKKLKFQNDKPSAEAYYSPMYDKVVVPMLYQYQDAEEYYSTTFHELTHSTIPPYRCDRKAENDHAFFGNEDYSREELVAELGSAMICNAINIDCEKAFKNSVAYIQGWLKALNNDNKMIVWAASRAEKAAKYIMNVKD
nr:anti-restriction protein [Caudoviricetes sp.]